MSKIVGVHGINQEYRGENTINRDWLPALKDGLNRAGVTLESDNDLSCAFYGHLFREGKKGSSIPDYDDTDIDSDWEEDLLLQWAQEVIAVEKPEVDSDFQRKGRVPREIQKALGILSESKFFGDIAEKFVIYFLKQVGDYFHNQDLREKIRHAIASCVKDDTRILVGHSLGSVACYEALCQHPEWNIEVLVTLGSPLGIRNLIFDRLEPLPRNNVGSWPGSVKKWVNIADAGDIVALEKNLKPLFDGNVEDKLVYNGSDAHSALNYLTAKETGEAIKWGLISP